MRFCGAYGYRVDPRALPLLRKAFEMAQRVHVVLEDDLDGSAAAETVSFALDGTTYEIDLSEKNASALRDALAPFVSVGRKAGRGGSGGRKTAKPSGVSPAEVRAWAKSNGYDVPERGRIPADVRGAFDAAN